MRESVRELGRIGISQKISFSLVGLSTISMLVVAGYLSFSSERMARELLEEKFSILQDFFAQNVERLVERQITDALTASQLKRVQDSSVARECVIYGIGIVSGTLFLSIQAVNPCCRGQKKEAICEPA